MFKYERKKNSIQISSTYVLYIVYMLKMHSIISLHFRQLETSYLPLELPCPNRVDDLCSFV